MVKQNRPKRNTETKAMIEMSYFFLKKMSFFSIKKKKSYMNKEMNRELILVTETQNTIY